MKEKWTGIFIPVHASATIAGGSVFIHRHQRRIAAGRRGIDGDGLFRGKTMQEGFIWKRTVIFGTTIGNQRQNRALPEAV